LTNALPSPFRPDTVAKRFGRPDFPRTLAGFVWRISAWDQFWLCLISLSVSLLDTAPIELQRRIIDQTVYSGNFAAILVLAGVYAGVVLAEGLVKLLMNLYRGWVAENAIRILRGSITIMNEEQGRQLKTVDERGVEAAMIVAEVEPIGGFAGDSLSEPLLQAGILVSVFGYLTYLNPLMALASFAAFSPQFVFVPLMQRAINRRVRERIVALRAASANVVDAHAEALRLSQEARFHEVFNLNMWIFELKYTLNFLMNLTMNLGTIGILVYRFQRLFRTGNLSEDFAHGLCPDEGFGVGIMVLEVVHDRALQFCDAFESAPADTFFGDLGKKALNHVEP
jgi:ABC-type multidrug transport system fused ATPase/permease subunit